MVWAALVTALAGIVVQIARWYYSRGTRRQSATQAQRRDDREGVEEYLRESVALRSRIEQVEASLIRWQDRYSSLLADYQALTIRSNDQALELIRLKNELADLKRTVASAALQEEPSGRRMGPPKPADDS